MKNLMIILMFLIIGCSSEAQRNNSTSSTVSKENKVVIENGILISFEGIDISKYELDIEDFDVEEVTKDHLLCLATDECDEELVLN